MQIIELEQNPCVVSYSKEFDVFIVGTYQLLNKASGEEESIHNQHGENLEFVNHRIGSIYIISTHSEILKHHRCLNGGIFDIKIHYIQQTSTCCINTAHSNGHVGIYEFENSLDLKLTNDYRVDQSNLLTCIDLYKITEETSEQKYALIVGDDTGYVNIITDGISTCRILVTEHEGYSVWQVKVFYCDQSDLLLTGSDDCMWRIYLIEEGQLTVLKVIKEFQGGITSFAIKPAFVQNQIYIFAGSYDETLRQYSFSFRKHSESQVVSVVEVNFIKKIQIPGSGLWRIKNLASEQKFLISGMYSGCYHALCDLSSYDVVISPDIDKKCKEKPLFYDIDISACNTFCIVDFNNKRCYMLERS